GGANAGPSAPTNVAAAPVGNAVAVTWQQPAGPDAAVYLIRRDDVPAMELPAGSLSWLDTTPGQSYSVRLQDRFGHLSQAVTTTVAGAAPTADQAAVTAPILTARLAGGALVPADGEASGRLLLVADPAAGAGVTFEFAADGDSAWTPVSGAPTCTPGCSSEWSLSGLAAGHYRLRGVSAAGGHGPALG